MKPAPINRPRGADAERTDALRQPAAEGTEEDQRQRKDGDADVGDPVGGVEVVENERPQDVERADHQEERGAEADRAGIRPDAQQIEREASVGLLFGRGLLDVDSREHRERARSLPRR